MTYALEDSYLVKGESASAGSRILDGFRAHFDAAVVTGLRERGFLPNLVPCADEFGIGKISSDSPAARSAALSAVADGSAAFAVFNDVFGARRREAASLGLFAVRPTYGSVSRYGLIPCAASMDQACVAARDARVAADALDAITGSDPRDGAMAPESFFAKRARLGGSAAAPVAGAANGSAALVAGAANGSAAPSEGADRLSARLRVYAPQSIIGSVHAPYGDAIEELVSRFDRVCDSEAGAAAAVFGAPAGDGSPHFDVLAPTAYILCSAEAYANTARYDGVKFGRRAAEYDGLADMYKKTRTQYMGFDAKLASIMGSMFLSSKFYASRYERAMKIRRAVATALSFAGYDLIATPTTMALDDRGDPYRDLSLYAPSALAGLPSAAFSYKGYGILLTARAGRESDLFFAREVINA